MCCYCRIRSKPTPPDDTEPPVDLYEYQARDLFERHGIPVLRGITATTPEQAQARSVPDYEEPAERQCPTD